MNPRDALRWYMNLLPDAAESTDLRVKYLYGVVRTEVLREAADALEEAVNEMRREDQSREPYRANSLGAGMVHAIGRLRSMADAETPST